MTHSTIAPVLMLAAFALAGCSAAPEEDADAAPLAATSDTLTRNALTNAEEKTALKLVDDICGDTWCSGDYDFRFDALVCGGVSRRCTLSLEILPRDGVPSLEHDYPRVCRTEISLASPRSSTRRRTATSRSIRTITSPSPTASRRSKRSSRPRRVPAPHRRAPGRTR